MSILMISDSMDTSIGAITSPVPIWTLTRRLEPRWTTRIIPPRWWSLKSLVMYSVSDSKGEGMVSNVVWDRAKGIKKARKQVKKFNQTTMKYGGPVVREAGDFYLVIINVTRLPFGIFLIMRSSWPWKYLLFNRESMVDTSRYLWVTVLDHTGRRRRRALTNNL